MQKYWQSTNDCSCLWFTLRNYLRKEGFFVTQITWTESKFFTNDKLSEIKGKELSFSELSTNDCYVYPQPSKRNTKIEPHGFILGRFSCIFDRRWVCKSLHVVALSLYKLLSWTNCPNEENGNVIFLYVRRWCFYDVKRRHNFSLSCTSKWRPLHSIETFQKKSSQN